MCLQCEDCPSEQEPQNKYSPGSILANEVLARIVIAPEHIDAETGTLTPGAIRIDDLMKRGWSLARFSHCRKDEIQLRGQEMASRHPNNSFIRVAKAGVAEIRQFKDHCDRQCLCVLDDAEPDFVSHAKAIRSANQSRSTLKMIRGRLIDLFNPIISVEDAYDQ